MSFYSDYNFGKNQEALKLQEISDYFNDKIIQTQNEYCKWDFEGEEYIYEIKSRNNKSYSYPTTLIAKDKILKGMKQRFIFNFTDGLYYIEYDDEVFKSFECKPFVRNARNDYNDKKKLYYFIETYQLIKITKQKIEQLDDNLTMEEREERLNNLSM
jgi:hypothetical protein